MLFSVLYGPSGQGSTQEITGAGNIASGEAFGSPVIDRPHIDPSGIASGETFGTPSLALHLSSSGITSGESFGTASVAAPITVTASGIASGEAFGSPVVSLPLVLDPVSIGSQEAFGSPSLLQSVTLFSIDSGEFFGLLTLDSGADELVGVGAMESAESFGAPLFALAIEVPPAAFGEEFGMPMALMMEEEPPPAVVPRGGLRIIYLGRRF